MQLYKNLKWNEKILLCFLSCNSTHNIKLLSQAYTGTFKQILYLLNLHKMVQKYLVEIICMAAGLYT